MIGQGTSSIVILAAAAVCASASLVSAATVTNIVDLNFSGSASGTAYTEPGGTYTSASLYADSLGTLPTVSGGMLNNINDTSTVDDPGFSVVPAGGSVGTYPYTLYSTLTTTGTNFVYETELTGVGASQGTGNVGSPAVTNIIAWEVSGHQFLDLRMGGNTVQAVVGNGGVTTTLSGTGALASLAPNTETHIGLVYVAPTSATSTGSVALYTINDSTGSVTSDGSTTVSVSTLVSGTNPVTLNDEIGLLNSAADFSVLSAGNQNRGFNGSMDSVIVGTFTGTFNPSTDFQLPGAVPEPSVIALLSLAGMAALRRRRRLE